MIPREIQFAVELLEDVILTNKSPLSTSAGQRRFAILENHIYMAGRFQRIYKMALAERVYAGALVGRLERFGLLDFPEHMRVMTMQYCVAYAVDYCLKHRWSMSRRFLRAFTKNLRHLAAA